MISYSFTRSDSTTCPLMQQSSQEDLPYDDNDNNNPINPNYGDNVDEDESYLRLQQQLGNGNNQSSLQSVHKKSTTDQIQQSQSQPTKQQKDPLLLKTSTLPTTSSIQYRYIRPASQDQYSSNAVS